MKTAIIGGGAAGLFLAINLKEMCKDMDITIFEKGRRLLRKVEISGGGRCNITNSFASVRDLRSVYPRGFRLMKRLFNVFDYHDAYQWFEQHGIDLITQEDNCVFPKSQDSHSVISCFLRESANHNIHISCNKHINSLSQLSDFDYIAVTTGGSQNPESYQWLVDCGHIIQHPIPSLFSFALDDEQLKSLMGLVINNVKVQLIGTKYKICDYLLITHWGISGPAVLLLSSHAAQFLSDSDYSADVSINWTNHTPKEIEAQLYDISVNNGDKLIHNYRPFYIADRLWQHLINNRMHFIDQKRWKELTKKDIDRITNTLSNDIYHISGRAPHKDEFVTCGGIDLTNIDKNTLQSKHIDNLYFAGEVLDIDGITGGFNFQAAWTTAYVVAKSIAERANSNRFS